MTVARAGPAGSRVRVCVEKCHGVVPRGAVRVVVAHRSPRRGERVAGAGVQADLGVDVPLVDARVGARRAALAA